MSGYNFTYKFPDNFQQKLIKTLNQNGKKQLAEMLSHCKITYNDVGLAFYAGLKGDTWDKHALDFIIETQEKAISDLKRYTSILAEWIEIILNPSVSGFLVRNIKYIICDNDMEIDLPENQDDDLETLSRDIYESLSRGEPSLVIDRLHTFSTKYLRELCEKHNINTKTPNGDYYPLHNLAGSLAKYYTNNKRFQSEFSEQAMKMSLSLFDKYNAVRNDQSFAHDNVVLNSAESAYAVKIMAATITFIELIENT